MKKWKCCVTVLVVIVAMAAPVMADPASFDANSYAVTIPAIDVGGQCYQVVLNYYANPSDPQNFFWIVDVNSLGTGLGCGFDSATLNLGNLDILIPFLEYQGAFYELTLNYAGDISGGGNFIWRLDLSSVGLTIDPEMDITIEANPNNVLSVYVKWTTQQPMDSEVQFGEGEYEFRIRDDTEVTDHEVLVIGMHAETEYLIKAVSSNSSGTIEAEGTWTTGSLPIGVPNGSMLTNNTAMSQPGWTLMNVQVGDGGSYGTSDYPAAAVMYDQAGLPVWYYINGDTPDVGGGVSTEFRDDNGRFSVLIGPASEEPPREVDLAGNIIWEGPAQSPENGSGFWAWRTDEMSHHVGKLSNGNYLLVRVMRTSSGGYRDSRLEEVTPSNEVVWEWNLYDFITAGETGDWCHPNSATVDISNDAVYLSCRWTGLYKTTYSDPQELVYHMPAIYNESATAVDVDFIPLDSQFNDIHDPEIHDDGTIMFFDNDGWDFTPTKPGGYHSRVLEFQVDETTMEATLVWEFPGDLDVDPWFTEDFYCPFWGDANRLENNNVLVTAGRRGVGSISHVFEVTNDGEVVWDFTLPEDHGVYRANRIMPPLVEPF